MKIQLIRHATLLLHVYNKKILVDPVLSYAGSISPIPDVPNQNSNPLVELPIGIEAITDCDGVLVTHTHIDHFDPAAAKLLPKNIPVFCQSQDEAKLHSYGFTHVYVVHTSFTWNGINFNRTEGKHGQGELAVKMAPVSGFIISAQHEPVVYIMGDTVWCPEVISSMEQFNPDIAVCNCGGAQFSYGEPITMTTEDISELCLQYPNTKVIAVHMDAWNHCRLSRKDLRCYINSENIHNVCVPEDGESIIQ